MSLSPSSLSADSWLISRLVPLEEMQARFGEESIWIYNILRVSVLHVVEQRSSMMVNADRQGVDHTEGTYNK